MADEALYSGKGWLSPIRGGSEHIRDSDYEIVTLSVGSNIAKVGFAVTSTGEVDPAVDLMAGAGANDTFRGIIIEPVIRPLPVAGVAWNPDVALIDGTEVRILKRTGGRVLMGFLASGYDTPLANLAGQFVVNTEDSAITVDSVGCLWTDVTEDGGADGIMIGILAEDFTTGNNTAAANASWQVMWY